MLVRVLLIIFSLLGSTVFAGSNKPFPENKNRSLTCGTPGYSFVLSFSDGKLTAKTNVADYSDDGELICTTVRDRILCVEQTLRIEYSKNSDAEIIDIPNGIHYYATECQGDRYVPSWSEALPKG